MKTNLEKNRIDCNSKSTIFLLIDEHKIFRCLSFRTNNDPNGFFEGVTQDYSLTNNGRVCIDKRIGRSGCAQKISRHRSGSRVFPDRLNQCSN